MIGKSICIIVSIIFISNVFDKIDLTITRKYVDFLLFLCSFIEWIDIDRIKVELLKLKFTQLCCAWNAVILRLLKEIQCELRKTPPTVAVWLRLEQSSDMQNFCLFTKLDSTIWYFSKSFHCLLIFCLLRVYRIIILNSWIWQNVDKNVDTAVNACIQYSCISQWIAILVFTDFPLKIVCNSTICEQWQSSKVQWQGSKLKDWTRLSILVYVKNVRSRFLWLLLFHDSINDYWMKTRFIHKEHPHSPAIKAFTDFLYKYENVSDK